MSNKKKNNKDEYMLSEEDEDWCFVCKDGGDLRICDHPQCLKAFHADCVEKDDSFLDSKMRWYCDWHKCFSCREPSDFHCFTCPKAVCQGCLHYPEFLRVRGKYGFCDECLTLAILIEEQRDCTTDGEKVDFTDKETYECLFSEYYLLIKDAQGIQLSEICAAQENLKKKKKKNKKKVPTLPLDLEELSDEGEGEKQMSDEQGIQLSETCAEQETLKKKKKKNKEKIPTLQLDLEELSNESEGEKQMPPNQSKLTMKNNEKRKNRIFESHSKTINDEEASEKQIPPDSDKEKKKQKRTQIFGESNSAEEAKSQVPVILGLPESNKKCKKNSNEKTSKKNKVTTPKKSNQMEFVGWGSKPLMEFLALNGKRSNEILSEDDVASFIEEYAMENELFHPEKKNTIMCNEPLKALFRKSTISKSRIFTLLEEHFAENQAEPMEDEVERDFENESAKIASAFKRQKYVDERPKEVENEVAKYPFAALVEENLKLVCLKKSVLYELLKEPESFEEKVIGCFVRAKSDQSNCSSKSSFELLQVTGVKAVSVGENNAEAILLFSNSPKEIGLSLISDGDFSVEECDVLKRQVLSGQLKRPTVVDFQEKANIVHKYITKHRIKRELVVLQHKIDHANEKGWRGELHEHRERKKLLESQSEESKLLANVPIVIPDTSELEPNAGDVKDMEIDVCETTSILQCDNVVRQISDVMAHHGHAEDLKCKKGQEDHEITDEPPYRDPMKEVWWVAGPHVRFKCVLTFMECLYAEEPYPSEIKVWKEYQNEESAISLTEAVERALAKRTSSST